MDIQKTLEQEQVETERLRAAVRRDNLRDLFNRLATNQQKWFLQERGIPCPQQPEKGRTIRQTRTRALLAWYDNLVKLGEEGRDEVRV